MPQVEHLHLKHVLQTVGALEAVVLRSFGPEGGQVLFTRDTGQVMLSRSGTRILTALRLEHPLARMVVECVWKHSKKTGDGSKTFILLLASLLRLIHSAAYKEPNVSHTYSRKAAEAATARHLAEELLAFGLEKLEDLIAVGVVPYGCCLLWEDVAVKTQSPASTNTDYVQKLVASFFSTRLGHTHCDFMGKLFCKLLIDWKFKKDPPSLVLQFINDNFSGLHTTVSGFPISCSRLVEGQVIHRDFATPCLPSEHQPVKAVVFTGCLQPKLLNAGEVLAIGGGPRLTEDSTREERSIMHFNTWVERSLECVFANLQNLGVSVLLFAVKQSDAVLALASQAEISVVECVSEDELFLFAHLSGATPVSEYCVIQPEHVATLYFCRPILLGAHRYVHVAFQESTEETFKACSIVICGPGEGQTDQYVCAFQDAIRMLFTTWEPLRESATISSETLQSHKSTSLHMCNQNDRTKSPSTSPPLQPFVLDPACVISSGGIFELLLHNALLQHGRTHSSSNHKDAGIPVVSQLLATALLCVPRLVHSHGPKHFLQTQKRVLSSIQKLSQPPNLLHKQGLKTSSIQRPSKDFILDSGLESVSCKYLLILAVLQCVTSLLRVDTVLRTHTDLHSHGHTNTSLEASEDED